MKVIIFNIILGLLTAISSSAQSRYETGMNQAFEHWQNNDPIEAANLFERIAKAEKENWLPYYYASRVKVVQSFSIPGEVQKEQLLKEAQELLDSARSLNGEEAELLVLQAMLHTARLTIDPATYGMKLSPVITQLYAEAAQKDPNNPRVILSKAEWDMGSAQFFGKDPTASCPDLQKSLELFAAEEKDHLKAVVWGEDRAHMLIQKSCGN